MRRFDAYSSALAVLRRAPDQDLSNEFVQSGVVDKFSVQFELGWKMLKELLRYEGVASAATGSPREILKEAFRYFAFIDERTWLCMLRDCNVIAHVYDEQTMQDLLERVLTEYLPAFVSLQVAVLERYGGELDSIA